MRIMPNELDRWYVAIARWEGLRLVYNLLMLGFGGLSIALANVNVPLIYLLIAVALNLMFTLVYLLDFVWIALRGNSISKRLYLSYLTLSIIFVFAISFWLVLKVASSA